MNNFKVLDNFFNKSKKIVRFKKLVHDAIPFKYSREADACMDIYSNQTYMINPFETKLISTGIALEIPEGYEGIIRGRSGLAANGLFVHVGTIDYEYRGEIKVVVSNMTNIPISILKNTKIAQFTIKPVIKIELKESSELSKTLRGENGYGSSGMF